MIIPPITNITANNKPIINKKKNFLLNKVNSVKEYRENISLIWEVILYGLKQLCTSEGRNEFKKTWSSPLVYILFDNKLVDSLEVPNMYKNTLYFDSPDEYNIVKYKGKNVYVGELPKIIELFGEDKGRWGNFVDKAKKIFNSTIKSLKK